MTRNAEYAVTFMGKKLDKLVYPKLYRWAKTNPAGLKKTLESMIKQQGFTNPGSAMSVLESDLK